MEGEKYRGGMGDTQCREKNTREVWEIGSRGRKIQKR